MSHHLPPKLKPAELSVGALKSRSETHSCLYVATDRHCNSGLLPIAFSPRMRKAIEEQMTSIVSTVGLSHCVTVALMELIE